MVSSAKLERARVMLMQGNQQGAREELDRANNREVWDRVRDLHLPAHDMEYFELAELRWTIFTGNVNDTIAPLECAISDAVGAKRHRRALKLRILQALAVSQQGNRRSALTMMGEVLKLASTESFMRIFLDEGERAGVLVRQLDEMVRADSGSRTDPIFSVYLQKLLEGFEPALTNETEAPLTGTKDRLIEPLTVKEIRILSLLADGYSNSALAEKLFVTDSTVRTHLRNINGKLNAQNRTQAVAIALKVGVIR